MAGYQVLARKWRPQDLESLIGQSHVARTLRNAVESGRFAHAYLFSGLRGTGKTTVARILAKCLNCEKGPTSAPCNRCASCVEITESRSLDVLEIDAASRTGVDDIRELQEVVSYAPVRDRYRILIIDEAHMLSKPAFNALLKTLEEPPPRVVFVLATTEQHKVLPTILSRCQIFEFRRVPAREVAAHLRKVCVEEGITISDRALERVALAGEGSVRDSLSVLERILAFCGREVRDEEAFQLLGNVRTDVLASVLRGMAARDAASLLTALDALLGEGYDLLGFWGELIGVIRDLLLVRTLPGRDDVLSRSPDEVRLLAAAAADLSADDLTRIFQVLSDLEGGLKASAQPRFLFEAAMIRIANLGAVRAIEEIVASLGSGLSPVASPAPRAPAPRPANVPASAPPPPSAPQKKKTDEPRLIASDLEAALHERRPSLAAMLGTLVSATVEADVVTLECGPIADVLRRTIERDDNVRLLAAIASDIAGRPLRARIAYAGGADAEPPARRAAAPSTAPPAKPAADGATAPAAAPSDRAALLDRIKKEPGVQKLLREFGAQVVDFRTLEPSAGPGGETDAEPPSEDNG